MNDQSFLPVRLNNKTVYSQENPIQVISLLELLHRFQNLDLCFIEPSDERFLVIKIEGPQAAPPYPGGDYQQVLGFIDSSDYVKLKDRDLLTACEYSSFGCFLSKDNLKRLLIVDKMNDQFGK